MAGSTDTPNRMRCLWLSLASAVCGLLLGPTPLRGGDAIEMRVSPQVAMAPAFLTVRVRVAAASDNRKLQVVAESPEFYRSSEIELDGERAKPLNVFEFRNLPSGVYQ